MGGDVEEGREITRGIGGDVKLKVGGIGSMIVACAVRVRVLYAVDTSNDRRVTSSGREGNGVLRPGLGSPGNGGTIIVK
jgi:hypothetical protein